MKMGMLFAALLLSGSSATSLLFSAPVGSKRSYQVTFTLWMDMGNTSRKGPVPTVDSLNTRTRPSVVTCQVLEEVIAPQDQAQPKGSREVSYTTACSTSDQTLLAPAPGTERFVYDESGSVFQSEPEVQMGNAPWERIGGAYKLERTPWGDLPSFYGTTLEPELSFSDNLRDMFQELNPPILGTIRRTLRSSGNKTLVESVMNLPAGRLSSPGKGSELNLLEPMNYHYKLMFGSDGRLERGSYRLSLSFIRGTSRKVVLVLAEIKALEP